MDWAQVPKQKFLTEEGKVGDCWRCCVAAVLGLPAEEVPHFLVLNDNERTGDMDADTQRWLNARGYGMVYASTFGGRESLRYPCYSADLKAFPSPVVIAAGPTPRSKKPGQHHAVVMQGGVMLYDPHPSEAGLTAITQEYLIYKL